MTEPTDAGPSTEDRLFRLIRSFGYTTHGQTAEIVDAIVANLWTPEQIAEAKEQAKKFEPWLLANQEPLGAEFEEVLDKHRSELYAEATPQPTQAQAGAVPQYRLLHSGVDRIEDDDEFLSDDTTTWAIDPNGIFSGNIYGGHVLRPARRRIKGGQHGAE